MSNLIKGGLLLIGALLITMIVRIVFASATRTSTPVVNTEKVRVSAADLPQGLLLRDEDIRWKQMPLADVPANAVISGASGNTELKGALLRHPMASGTPFVTDDVILPNAPGFLAATLKPEMRAISVAVDDVSGNAGLIQPGDYVDLLLTQQMDRRTDSPDLAVSSETVVEHVRVLAVGSVFLRPKNGDTSEANNRARTVTLEVTARMGEGIAVAARLGSLSLELRSFATASREPSASSPTDSQPAPVWAGDISRAVRELPKPHAPQAALPLSAGPAAVIIYRGSEQSDASGTAPAAGAASPIPPLPALPVAR